MPTTPSALRLRFLAALGALPLAACGERYDDTICLSASDEASCPSQSEASEQLVGPSCGYRVVSVDGPAQFREGDTADTGMLPGESGCCYPVTKQELNNGCVVGRPYFEEGRLVTAPASRATGW